MSNAKADYAEKYNRYIAMNYSSAEASRLALHAKEVKDKLASTAATKVQIASAWDPDTGGIVTTICLSD